MDLDRQREREREERRLAALPRSAPLGSTHSISPVMSHHHRDPYGGPMTRDDELALERAMLLRERERERERELQLDHEREAYAYARARHGEGSGRRRDSEVEDEIEWAGRRARQQHDPSHSLYPSSHLPPSVSMPHPTALSRHATNPSSQVPVGAPYMDRTASALSLPLGPGMSPPHRALGVAGRYDPAEERIERSRACERERERERMHARLAARGYERGPEWALAHERELAHAQEWTVNAIARAEADRERAEAAALALGGGAGERGYDAPLVGHRRESRGRIESWQDGLEPSERPGERRSIPPRDPPSPSDRFFPPPDRRLYTQEEVDTARAQHEAHNQRILAEAQDNYAFAIAEREQRAREKRLLREDEVYARFGELVGGERRRQGDLEREREAQRVLEAKTRTLEEIEADAAVRVGREQEFARLEDEEEQRFRYLARRAGSPGLPSVLQPHPHHILRSPSERLHEREREWAERSELLERERRERAAQRPFPGSYGTPSPEARRHARLYERNDTRSPPRDPYGPRSFEYRMDDPMEDDVKPALLRHQSGTSVDATPARALEQATSPAASQVDPYSNGFKHSTTSPQHKAASRRASESINGDLRADAAAPARSSPRPSGRSRAAAVPLLELPAEEWPTKGIRNKDGSYRKKPGPPKGIKKPPPRNKNPESSQPAESIADRASSVIAEGAVDDALLEALSEGGDSIAEKRPANKRRKLDHTSIKAEPEGEKSAAAHSLATDGDAIQANHEVDEELDELINGDSPPPPANAEVIPEDATIDDEIEAAADPFASGSVLEAKRAAKKARPNKGKNKEARPDIEPDGTPVVDDVIQAQPYPPAGDHGTSPGAQSNISENGPAVSVSTALRRYEQVSYMQHVIWQDIAKYQIPKVHKYVQAGISNRLANTARVAAAAARTQRRFATRPGRTQKEMQLKARKAAKEAQLYWKRNEKDEIELRKKAEREAIEQAKAVEAARERRRAERKLNFLLSSGELYSHFMQKKIKTNEAADAPEGDSLLPVAGVDEQGNEVAHGAIGDIDFDDDDEEKHDALLKQHAAARAKAVMNENLSKAADFDQQVSAERAYADMASEMNAEAPDELDFQNPLAGGDQETITQPKMLMAQLKEYQLKGLSWLGNLYEQGINGILADEMGLGKTVQSISLLAYLAEKHNIWGPFLVVAPASTVHNWQQELTRFVPKLKALPYWGQPNDRKVLRKDWNRKSIIFTEDAPFHIVVTSYDMAVLDAAYFSKVRWQYMILDEAQAVKNSQSLRWNTLLSLKCRNRLLLTGTPIQNSMQELWALLHFIMPQLFDSHEDFSEWFSKGIEGVAGGRDNNLSSHQLKRLHEVLRPFMLRRVKKNVQSELGDKIEIDLMVDLSPRQKVIYRALRSNASIRALLAQAADLQDNAKVNNLMNVVMQFRKVCNHPYLFERADVVSPFSFARFNGSGNLIRQESLYCPAYTKNPINMRIPRLLWEDGGILARPSEKTRAGFDTRYMQNLLNIWSSDRVAESVKENDSAFAFRCLLQTPSSRLVLAAHGNTIANLLQAAKDMSEELQVAPFSEALSVRRRSPLAPILPRTAHQPPAPSGLVRLGEISKSHWERSWLSHTDARFFIEPAVAPPIEADCSSRSFLDTQAAERSDPKASLALFGLPTQTMREDQRAVEQVESNMPGLPSQGLFRSAPLDQAPTPAMRFPDMKRLIFDSAKLARLDGLLRGLKQGGHRVLIYFQMTRMMTIMEEYLIYRQYKYLRLDGASVIADRRDMVNAWQTNPDIFVFLLSTKAGGLGINLTAADTVIFYDHDWNPSNDSQAMDRAHRLGQTRQVTVYRLIARGTVDERILHLARGKKDVQDIVVGNKSLADITSQKEIVSLLLDDEEISAGGPADAFAPPTKFGGIGGNLDGDEDDFFGVTAKKQKAPDADGEAVDEGADGERKPKRARMSKPKTTKTKDGAPKKSKAVKVDGDGTDGSSAPAKNPRARKFTGSKSKLGGVEPASGFATPVSMTPGVGGQSNAATPDPMMMTT